MHIKITKKFSKKFGSKVINRQYVHIFIEKLGLSLYESETESACLILHESESESTCTVNL